MTCLLAATETGQWLALSLMVPWFNFGHICTSVHPPVFSQWVEVLSATEQCGLGKRPQKCN